MIADDQLLFLRLVLGKSLSSRVRPHVGVEKLADRKRNKILVLCVMIETLSFESKRTELNMESFVLSHSRGPATKVATDPTTFECVFYNESAA